MSKRLQRLIKYCSLTLWVITSIIFITNSLAFAQDEFELSQQSLSSVLRHQENLVKTVECIFEVNVLPTNSDNLPLIHLICDSSNRDAEQYTITKEIAQSWSFVKQWWRKDAKEREDSFALTDYDPNDNKMKPIKMLSFDGLIVRSLNRSNDGIYGSINTMETAHLDTTNFVDPYSFLYEFLRMPYSELIAKGRNFSSSKQTKNGKEYIQVSVQHPKLVPPRFILIFDDQYRLVERQVINQFSDDPSPRLYERHTFSNYKKFKDKSGEVIWFPQTAVYNYYMGNLPDSSPVEYETKKINVRKISFNLPISDDKFVISFPPGTKIYDGINKLGWTDNIANYYKNLKGNALPDFNDLNISLKQEDMKDKSILICFWDLEQRPSRNCIQELNKKAEELKHKNIVIIAVQASKTDKNSYNDWIKEHNINIPMSSIEAYSEITRYNWGVKALPWLILTNKEHIVTEEGLSINELYKKTDALK